MGPARPGYLKALKLGMTELRDDATRARACADCHYVTDPRLISSGHPSGVDFDYAAAVAKIRHWQSPLPAAGALPMLCLPYAGGRATVYRDWADELPGSVQPVPPAKVASSLPPIRAAG